MPSSSNEMRESFRTVERGSKIWFLSVCISLLICLCSRDQANLKMGIGKMDAISL
jgi:hypothetical protein